VSYKVVAAKQGGRWVARAEDQATGRPFGIECTGTTEQDAVDRLSRWLEWQRAHAGALETLQRAERAYHRAIASGAFAGSTDGPSPLETQKASLAAVDAARVRLDEVRARQPDE
jgi:hypothetical protein